MMVVDASALIEVPLRTAVARGWKNGSSTVTRRSTRLICSMQVIRRYAANREIDSDGGRAAVADLADFPLHRYPHDVLLPRIWNYGTI
jgi:predicted nucleic acid-binding protein